MNLHRYRLPCLLLILTAVSSAQTLPSKAFSVTATFALGGEGRWDYVSIDDQHRLYVTRSTHTQVIDTASGKVVADIAHGAGLHGTAIAAGSGRGYISDGRAGELIAFDLKTDAILGTIKAADDADGIIYDAGSDRVLVGCGDAGALLTLDPKVDIAAAKVEKIDLAGKPEFIAADGKGHAYVCINDKNVIAEVDILAGKVTHRWPCGSGTSPTGLAIDGKAGRLFVGCRNQKMIVMSTANGKVLAELPIGQGNDACAFDPGTGAAFASCGDGTITAVVESSPNHFAVEQIITTARGARTMTIDPSTHTLYLPTASFQEGDAGKRPAAVPNSFKILVVSRPKS